MKTTDHPYIISGKDHKAIHQMAEKMSLNKSQYVCMPKGHGRWNLIDGLKTTKDRLIGNFEEWEANQLTAIQSIV